MIDIRPQKEIQMTLYERVKRCSPSFIIKPHREIIFPLADGPFSQKFADTVLGKTVGD